MAIRESRVPGVYPGAWQSVYRVVGDPNRFRSFSNREEAEKREAELTEQATDTDD